MGAVAAVHTIMLVIHHIEMHYKYIRLHSDYMWVVTTADLSHGKYQSVSGAPSFISGSFHRRWWEVLYVETVVAER
jgi:hypothetical protein